MEAEDVVNTVILSGDRNKMVEEEEMVMQWSLAAVTSAGSDLAMRYGHGAISDENGQVYIFGGKTG